MLVCSTWSSPPLSVWAPGENVGCLITERLTKIASWEMQKMTVMCCCEESRNISHQALESDYG